MLSLALPKGSSLERRTLDLFAAAGLDVTRPSEGAYRGTIAYGGPVRIAFFKPREIPLVVAAGTFDAGLTGADWIEETGAKVESVVSFTYSKATDAPWRVVLAVPDQHAAQTVQDLGHGTRIATEYPSITRRFLQDAGIRADVVHSYGATEAKIPELADAIVDVVDTGSSLDHNGLRIITTIRTCTPWLIASPQAWRDVDRQRRIQGMARLLDAAQARSANALLTVRVPAHCLHRVARSMPERSWRVGVGLHDTDLVVVQGLAQRAGLPDIIDHLLEAGALDVTQTDGGMTTAALLPTSF
ncbi:ATP phosphoribosyltransferase [Streptomyces sp. NPDC090445]|uniref:ATP phosphoribosyltransferase n=1 Tax=Streptomyces sp. NPDC090445 TaxID=3365963 RepID=UPI00381FD5EE